MSEDTLSVLCLCLFVGEPSEPPYNDYVLSWYKKYDVSVCCYFREMTETPPGVKLFSGGGTLWGTFRALRAAMTAKPYDIIHIHTVHMGLIFLIVNFLLRGPHRHSTVFTVHSSYPNYKLRNKLLLIPAFAFFDRLVCCSRSSYDSFPRFFRWLAGDRLMTIRNGTNLVAVDQKLNSTPAFQTPSDRFRVVVVGRLIDIKRPTAALRAFHQSDHSSSELVFIGDGPLAGELRQVTASLGLQDHVRFLGQVSRAIVYEQLIQAGVFISCSRGEGLPMAVLEAMACHCPMILSDIPPHREILDGANFVPLIALDDLAGFAHEIERIRQLSPAERAEIGQKERRLVARHFSLDRMLGEYETLFRQLHQPDSP